MNIAQLTALINTNLASASNITAAELRQVLIAMLGGDYVTGTHAEIRALKTGNQLKVNTAYLITDFQTIYDRPDYEDVGGNIVPKMTIATVTAAVEPLLLFATSPNTFSPYVFSPSNPQDIIQYDIDYVSTFVNNAAAKGRITRRIDEFKNESNHDLRAVTFKLYDRSGDGVFKWFWDDNNDDSILVPAYGSGCNANQKGEEDYNFLGAGTGFDLDNFVMGDNCIGNKLGVYNFNNTWGDNNGLNTWGNFNQFNVWGNVNQFNVWGSNIEGATIFDNMENVIIEHSFINFTGIDFSIETLLSDTFTKWIYADKTDGVKLRYFDGGTLTIADVND
jgi:hypothetical protein